VACAELCATADLRGPKRIASFVRRDAAALAGDFRTAFGLAGDGASDRPTRFRRGWRSNRLLGLWAFREIEAYNDNAAPGRKPGAWSRHL